MLLLSNNVSASDLDDTAKVSAIASDAKGLNLTDKVKEKLHTSSERNRCVRKLTLLSTHWHSCSSSSNITDKPTQLKVKCKPKIQVDLPFNDSY